MGDTSILLHAGIAITAVIVLIVVVRLNPAIVLILGSLYLGIASGLGLTETVDVVAQGFGDLMTEIGLIIGFGVLLGSLLAAAGGVERIVEATLKVFGREGSPYALGLSTTVVFPAIYFDVLVVMLSPLTRSIAVRTGLGIAAVSGPLVTGLAAGFMLVVPGAGALAIAGALGVPLGSMLVFGLLVAVPTVTLMTWLYRWLVKRGLWNSDQDEAEFTALTAADHVAAGHGSDGDAAGQSRHATRQLPSLLASLAPIVLPLVLIVGSKIASATGIQAGVVTFLGNGIIALLLGLLAAYVLARRMLPAERIDDALDQGLKTSGLILLYTGAAGSLGAVLGKTGIADIVSGLESAGTFTSLLLAWTVAAFLRVAQGSGLVAALTAAGLMAPIVGDLDVPAVLVGLAAGSGSLLGGHVNDNVFWLFRSLLGLSTRGTFKIFSLPEAMAAVVSLPLILALSLVV